jgi:hypothetical protein
MTKSQKIALAIGGVALLALVTYIFYRRRWRTFENIGDSRWLPTTKNDARLGLRMTNRDHGIKIGDKVEIDHGNADTPTGETTVVDIVDKGPHHYIVTNFKAPASNPDHGGKVRVVS